MALFSAQERIRTFTSVCSHAPEACASTNSATWAFKEASNIVSFWEKIQLHFRILPLGRMPMITLFKYGAHHVFIGIRNLYIAPYHHPFHSADCLI